MYCVVDVETTGLSAQRDRIVEIAVVGVDIRGATEWAWTTVLNPQRDIGPTHIHGLRAKDVQSAPTFSDVAGYLAYLFSGRIFVAHNASFDWRFIDASFEREGIVTPVIAQTCTCQTARSIGIYPATLSACCEYFGITNQHAHSALGDALATAELLARIADLNDPGVQENVRLGLQQAGAWPFIPISETQGVQRPPAPVQPPMTTRPEGRQSLTAFDGVNVTFAQLEISTVNDDEELYLGAVERALGDRIITEEETAELEALAGELALTSEQVATAHQTFLRGVAASYWVDGIISASEHQDLTDVAAMLGLPESAADEALRDPRVFAPTTDAQLTPGDRVVFTGDMETPRPELEDAAKAAGLRVVGSVSRLTKLLIASDPASESGKARKAREVGTPIVTEHVFLRRLHDMAERSPDTT